ncbi:Cytosine/adenosine deaminase or related metal-dependent hydrolase [Gulbenkiania indica]|uniref:5-methylthioadenosine/S-adenosylhomocysteine deaminase n=2 Tax=Gulbenkiania TaxID=397456 RepID=A0A0K6H634_9NEIS|nr:TRZ/ATZ family hydrolase [Gulbenkiania indica]TCW33673.1 5-methylthioadenosine/S-adenosylhomocysteine deaminase [Gulbenkiania mobilis]CUA86450.1 Cytosine/adenosine deaminase or related metal-dependent hydrolase [Gulbenkiania indica]
MLPTHCDTLISARWIITVEHDGEVLENHSVAIEKGHIVAILPTAAAAGIAADEHIDLGQQVLMPGLVNLHGHSSMTLLRGLADDKALMDWLNNHIWPAEGRHVRDDFVFDGSLLAMAEMIRCGTTTINDMYFFHGAVARAGLAAGMRTFVGCSILEFPTNYANNADDYISKALAERREYLGEELVTFTLAPHAPYTVSDDTFRKVVTLAEEEDMLIHCHIHETADEVEGGVREHHQRPLARLKALGLLTPRLIAAHMVHLSEEEVALAARHGLSIAHNPSSNMKLASGIAPVKALLDAGANVGLGTDGAASNNKLDMLAETRLAALLAKVGTGDPTAVPAATAIRMATLNGARALGLGERTGSVRVGKEADLIAIDLARVETAPAFDPVSHVVYAAGREQVSHVWVKGRPLLKAHRLVTLDEQDLLGRAEDWRNRILSH